MPNKLISILSIAGSDPTAGAGIQADIKTGVSLGIHVLTAVTSVTIQNSKGLYSIGNVSPKSLEGQLNAILSDVIPDAVKIGMIGSKDNLKVIVDFLNSIPGRIPIVLDPLINASSNGKVLSKTKNLKELITLYKHYLFPLVDVMIPNKSELNIYLENKKNDYKDLKVIRENLNVKNLIVTNGDSLCICDYLVSSEEIFSYTHSRISCPNLHGTGCVYSTLITCYLALGHTLEKAFRLANERINDIIVRSCDYILGNSSYGPLNINKYYL